MVGGGTYQEFYIYLFYFKSFLNLKKKTLKQQIEKHQILYLNPWEITDTVFLIKENDDEGYTFKTIVS